MREYPIQMADKTGLVCIDPSQLKDVLLCAGALDPLVESVRKLSINLIADPMTEDGRLQRRELGAKVRKATGALDKMRKGVVDELKEQPKAIDANVREARKELEAIEAEILRPLTEMDARADRLRIIADRPNILSAAPIAQLEQELATAQAMGTEEAEWKERTKEAELVKIGLVEALEALIAKRKQDEADRLELERLRAEKAEKEMRERIERETRERLEREQREKAEREAADEARAKRAAAEAVEAEEAAKNQPATEVAPIARTAQPIPQPAPVREVATPDTAQSLDAEAYADLVKTFRMASYRDPIRYVLDEIKRGNIRHITANI